MDHVVGRERFTTEHAMMKLAGNSAATDHAEPVTHVPTKSESVASVMLLKTTNTLAKQPIAGRVLVLPAASQGNDRWVAQKRPPGQGTALP